MAFQGLQLMALALVTVGELAAQVIQPSGGAMMYVCKTHSRRWLCGNKLTL